MKRTLVAVAVLLLCTLLPTSALAKEKHSSASPDEVASDMAASRIMNPDSVPTLLPNEYKVAKGEGTKIKMPKPSPGKEGNKDFTPSAVAAQAGSSVTPSAPPYVFDWINDGTTLSHTDLANMALGTQTNINSYVSLYWGHKVNIRVFDSYAQWQAQSVKGWPVLLQTQAAMGGECGEEAGGCHGVQNGMPIAWVGQFDLPGTSWVLDHETIETLEDPFLNRVVQIGNAYYRVEVVDPTANYSAGYWVNGTYKTDWTTTYFWIPGYPKPYNFRQTTPRQLQPDCTWPDKAGIVGRSFYPDTSGWGSFIDCAASPQPMP